MKKMVFFICLLVLTAGLSAKNQNRKLINCQTCGEYKWLVVEFSEKEKIIASQTDSVVIIEKSGLSLAKIKSWDKNLSEEEAILTAIKKVLVVDQRTDYLPNGLMPKKIKKPPQLFSKTET
jgi:hypothetical protein